MKKIHILYTTMLLAMVIAGCKKGFLSQEVNPNTPSVATPQNILSGAENTTASTLNTGFTTFGIWLGYYAPSGNFTISATTEQYNFTNASFSQFGLYANITNYSLLISRGAADPSLANFAAIGKIMTVLDYQLLVDNYNSVPYTQAIGGVNFLFPTYDSGPNLIYPDLMVQLDAAIAMINSNTTATNPASSDIIFGGSMAKWKKLANTLKLRIAIRQSNIPANKAGLVTELAKTSSEGYLDDVTFASANPGYLSSDANGGQQNPYWKTYGFSAAGIENTGHATNRANAFFVNLLKTTGSDTLRLKQIYAPTLTKAESALVPQPAAPNRADHIVGNQFGNDNSYLSNTNTSGLGPGILISPTMSAPIFTGAEACFLLSEGILEGLIPGTITGGAGTAQDYYQRGITANFVALGLTSGQATTYYSQPIVNVNWVTTAAVPGTLTGYAGANGTAPAEPPLLGAIMYQKYIALFGFSVGEEYNEYRRTGLPNLLPARSQATGVLGVGSVPNRVFWPSSEATTNAANYALLPTINPFVDLIFWARNVN